MRRRLSALEQIVMESVWENPGCTVAQCQEALEASARPLKENTVRTLLSRLEKKGYVTHHVEGRAFLYRACDPRKSVAAQAVQQIIDRFCGGSLEEMLTGMVENDLVSPAELQKLALRVARAKGSNK
jgi:BlaI family transcriptional regulator, penicillinase repressor